MSFLYVGPGLLIFSWIPHARKLAFLWHDSGPATCRNKVDGIYFQKKKWIGYCLLDSFLGWGIIVKVPNGLIITFTIYFILIKRILNDTKKSIFELKEYILTINKIKFGVKGWHFIIYFTQIFFISLKKVVHHLCPHQKSLHGRLVV